MPEFQGSILGHHVVAKLSDLTGSFFVEIDGVKRATGDQWVADKPVVLDLDGHQLLIRMSGVVLGKIEIFLDGQPISSV